jgi:hypothetical protein
MNLYGEVSISITGESAANGENSVEKKIIR